MIANCSAPLSQPLPTQRYQKPNACVGVRGASSRLAVAKGARETQAGRNHSHGASWQVLGADSISSVTCWMHSCFGSCRTACLRAVIAAASRAGSTSRCAVRAVLMVFKGQMWMRCTLRTPATCRMRAAPPATANRCQQQHRVQQRGQHRTLAQAVGERGRRTPPRQSKSQQREQPPGHVAQVVARVGHQRQLVKVEARARFHHHVQQIDRRAHHQQATRVRERRRAVGRMAVRVAGRMVVRMAVHRKSKERQRPCRKIQQGRVHVSQKVRAREKPSPQVPKSPSP